MPTPLKIDFVSDVACPWCAVGLAELELALARLRATLQIDLEFQPFELNPNLAPEGQDMAEHLSQKYGASPAQLAQTSEQIRARGEALGFHFDFAKRTRIYNTFDAQRLLYWTKEDRELQRTLKWALLKAYFTQGKDVSQQQILHEVAVDCGVNPTDVDAVLYSTRYTHEVQEREAFYRQRGIQAVPSVIIGERHLIQGAQSHTVYEQALRRIAEAED